MSKRWLITLLLISFSFNLAVLFSFLYLRVAMPCPVPSERERRMPSATPFFRDDPEIEDLHTKFGKTKLALMEELAKDPVNETKVRQIIDSSLVAQNILEHRLGEKILAHRKTMTASEAKEHFERRQKFMNNRPNRINQRKHRRLP